jgi:signal transduction histidine kinase
MSLRLRLLLAIGISLTLLWSTAVGWVLLDLRQGLRVALDDRLAASARMVAGLASQLSHDEASSRNTAAAPPLDVIGRDGLACEVSLLRGELLALPVARTAGSPSLANAAPGYGTHVFGGKPWRTYVLVDGGLRIATADRLDLRDALLRDVAVSMLVPFIAALIAGMALLWLSIGHGLAPLVRLREALEHRRTDDSAPMPEIHTPAELQPLVNTMQSLLSRLHRTIDRERSFADDAAHELRTPLTAIKTHLQVMRLALVRPGHADTVWRALTDAETGVQALQATLEQLLILARLEGPSTDTCTEPADAEETARQAISDLINLQNGYDQLLHGIRAGIQLDAPKLNLAVAVPAPLLRIALRNLLDNALRHGGSNKAVKLCISQPTGVQVLFSVNDQGRGLNEQERAQALQRFWRHSPGTIGSGLGLPIVQAIAERHSGTLELCPIATGGLSANLTLPVCTSRVEKAASLQS